MAALPAIVWFGWRCCRWIVTCYMVLSRRYSWCFLNKTVAMGTFCLARTAWGSWPWPTRRLVPSVQGHDSDMGQMSSLANLGLPHDAKCRMTGDIQQLLPVVPTVSHTTVSTVGEGWVSPRPELLAAQRKGKQGSSVIGDTQQEMALAMEAMNPKPYLPVYLSIYPSTYPSIYLSVYLSI